MGKTIRTIIVLLAAVMLLAGCDPKMGDQGGFGTQSGGEESRTGETLNGIYFPWIDKSPEYVGCETDDDISQKVGPPLSEDEDRIAWGEATRYIEHQGGLEEYFDILTDERLTEEIPGGGLDPEGKPLKRLLSKAFHARLKPGVDFVYQHKVRFTEYEILEAQIGDTPSDGTYHRREQTSMTFTFDNQVWCHVVFASEEIGETTLYDWIQVDGKYIDSRH